MPHSASPIRSSGELCSQDDNTNVWKYDHYPSNETCSTEDTDYRCNLHLAPCKA
ncbi:hypothetical protein PR003_g19967 [Phytophthora rubi]|uniref:Uncharacterized protein n=1 Tax=Phytophthora rubi TaxID=129364 RepID=A0A6A4DNI3_9STRA|nr:hypothetical protein PR003_g19967 [Phytophthora rubi]